VVVALHGDVMLHAVTVRNCDTGQERTIETSFLFLCLGGVPNTQWAKEVGIVRDEEGYLVTGPDLRKFDPMSESWKLNREPYYLETSMPGVFAAGDVRHGSIKRVASAVGEGAMTIAFVHRYIASGYRARNFIRSGRTRKIGRYRPQPKQVSPRPTPRLTQLR
jgi:thioredoxin reductase (NADPH)